MEIVKNNIDLLKVSFREIKCCDVKLIIDYWYHSEPGFVESMCVDLSKLSIVDKFKAQLE